MDLLLMTEQAKQFPFIFLTLWQNGSEKVSYTFEEQWKAHDPVSIQRFTNVLGNTISMTITPEAIINTSMEFIGENASAIVDTELPGATYVPALTDAPYNGTTNVSTFRVGGANNITGPNFTTSVELNINNNLTGIKAVGIEGNAEVSVGSFDVNMQFNTLFASPALYNSIIANNDSSMDMVITDSQGHGLVFDVVGMSFTSGQVELTDGDSPLELNPSATGFKPDGFDYTLSLSQFEYVV